MAIEKHQQSGQSAGQASSHVGKQPSVESMPVSPHDRAVENALADRAYRQMLRPKREFPELLLPATAAVPVAGAIVPSFNNSNGWTPTNLLPVE